MTAFKAACDQGVADGRARDKAAFIGVGAQVADLGNNLGLSLGLPYGVALQYRLADGPGWSPHIGLGLTGPHIGASYRRAPPAAPPDEKTAPEGASGEKKAFFGLFGKKPAAPPQPDLTDINHPANVDLLNKLMEDYMAPHGHTHATADEAPATVPGPTSLWEEAYLHALNHPDFAHVTY